jgi:peptide/nickel transport system substrate-binding protein
MQVLGAALALVLGTPAARAYPARVGTLVFAVDVDPIALDGALVHDKQSWRVLDQITEGLVGLSPGGTRVVPKLARSWKASEGGRSWTFFLRRGVRFHDGTAFNAFAVCFNFDRWYGFTGSLQNPDATFYWQTVFGGFRNPEPGYPGPHTSLYRGCNAIDPLTVRLLLTRRTAGFLAGLALPAFGIASPTALKAHDADAGDVDGNGVFHPAGTYSTRHPTGTGPFMFKSWTPRKEVVLVRNERYWGQKAKLARIVYRIIPDNSVRVRALHRGDVQALDDLVPDPATIMAIKRDPNLKVLDRPAFNVGYVGINQAIPPMNKLLVRQAVASGLDRAAVARSFYGGSGVVADQFLPPALVGHASGIRRYAYNPAKARALLRRAGLTLPVKVDFWFPTDVSRPYMLDPKRNFAAFAASLRKSGFEVVPHSAPWSPDYLRTVTSGKAQLYLLGWIGDWPDPADWLGLHFGKFNPQFGFRAPRLFDLLTRAVAETDLAKRAGLYRSASRMVMELLPMVPYVYLKDHIVLRRNVVGYVPAPTDPANEPLSRVSFGSG